MADSEEKTTEQVSVTPPEKRNPTGKGGFGDHPENRNPGGWNKDEAISYQYNLLLRLPPEELSEFKPSTVAQKIAWQRLTSALSKEGLMDTKEVTDRTEGKAPQSIDLTSGGGPLEPLTVRIIDERQRDTDTE